MCIYIYIDIGIDITRCIYIYTHLCKYVYINKCVYIYIYYGTQTLETQGPLPGRSLRCQSAAKEGRAATWV